MKMTKAKSSTVASYGYDGSFNTLIIQFNNESEYAYGQVDVNTFLAFDKAESKGKFLGKYIINNKDFPCVRIK